jgi:ribosomal protein S18 acetylase RimI-like enzyme
LIPDGLSLAFRYAPRKILAYNSRLERHHLRPSTPIASALFLRGVPLDRIWLRPKWLFPLRQDRSTEPSSYQEFEGRPLRSGKPRMAVLTPYFPYPLSHGGAVRIYNLLREGARDFDIFLFSFAEKTSSASHTPLLDFCSKVVTFPNPRYREPRWASLLPPEVNEFASAYVRGIVQDYRERFALHVMQVEYTQMATYGGEILVEHDVTFDLHEQVVRAEPTLAARWNLRRWQRYESKAIDKYQRVVVMSEKDSTLLGNAPNLRVIPNGVDLKRFHVAPEEPGRQILFVGSFRHFPNVVAFRWFVEHVWPRLNNVRFVTIAGPNPELYLDSMPNEPNLEIHGFVSDVRPFYEAANVVVVPTQVSAGTNLKALESLACQRVMVSTTSGCAGLGLKHGENVWIADDPQGFAEGIEYLLGHDVIRRDIAASGRDFVAKRYGWSKIGQLQARLWNELLTGIVVRPGNRSDTEELRRIQLSSHTASHWEPETYFEFDVLVAERAGTICGFLVSRNIAGEIEVLNLATSPEARRQGVATALLGFLDSDDIFLEVRESNRIARKLYEKLGFSIVGTRAEYYDDPVETALVMRLSRVARS